MKHLHNDAFSDQPAATFGASSSLGGTSSGVSVDRLRLKDSTTTRYDTYRLDAAVPPEMCLRCSQKLRVMQQLEEKPKSANLNLMSQSDEKSKEESSFEDLSTDLLISKFRFVIVDCRLNALQQEVALPHCLTFEVLAASKAEQLKTQIKSLLDYKDNYHICLLGLDRAEDSSVTAQTRSQSSGKISIKHFHDCVLRFLTTELVR